MLSKKDSSVSGLRGASALDNILSVDVDRAARDVHAEFADVVERLLSVEFVLSARREAAVVIQLDGADRLVWAEVVAVRDVDHTVVVALPLYETRRSSYSQRYWRNAFSVAHSSRFKSGEGTMKVWDIPVVVSVEEETESKARLTIQNRLGADDRVKRYQFDKGATNSACQRLASDF